MASTRITSRIVAPALQAATFVAAGGLWEVVSRTELIPSRFLPPMSNILDRLWELVGTSSFWGAIRDTMTTWAWGMLISVSLGVAIGLLIGTSHFLTASTQLVVDFLRSVPPVALIPLMILQFGATPRTKLILVVYGAVFPVLIGAIFGAGSVDRAYGDVAKVYRIGPVARYFRITLPAAAPFMMSGVRIAASIAVIVAVVVEIITGAPGIGAAMTDARLGQDFEGLYALILATGVLGIAVNAAVGLIEPVVIGWHPSVRRAS